MDNEKIHSMEIPSEVRKNSEKEGTAEDKDERLPPDVLVPTGRWPKKGKGQE